MIQIISNNIEKYKDFSKQNFLITAIDEFQSFDNYEITAIDISDGKLWRNKGADTSNINQYMDFKSIPSAIKKTQKSNIILLFPQNIDFYYNYCYIGSTQKYSKARKLKDIKRNFIDIISSNLLHMNFLEINFGKSYTQISNCKIVADFSFLNVDEENIIIRAENGNDVVTIKNDKVMLTTLMISSEEELMNLLKKIFPNCFEKGTIPPNWIKEIDFYTDKECKNNIIQIDEKICKLTEEKNRNENILKENFEYKKILFESGDILANQINKMLSKIFDYDMTAFKDIYEEDGLIKLDDITFVIETKGLNNEISGHNVSDAGNHLIMYEDKLEENGISENAKCLFIVAYERNKNINDRVDIKDRIIKIAQANNTLIVDTRIFLEIYEDFLNKNINKEEIKNLFKDNIGVLKYNKVN